MAAPIGPCRICGVVGPLTFEHVPPRVAFNDGMAISLDLARYLHETPRMPISTARRRKERRGSGGYYLCATCNNLTGAWYVEGYADWAFQAQRMRASMGGTNSLALPFRIFPGRVFKQVLAMLACTSGHKFFEANPALRKLVLDPQSTGMPGGLRLYCYIVHPEDTTSRASGVAGMITPRGSFTLTEFAFPPFGYLLTLGGSGVPDTGLFDISFFGQHNHRAYRELHLPLPIRSVASYFPADYRTKKEWEDINATLPLSDDEDRGDDD